MSRSQRRIDPSKKISHLEQRHQQLKAQVEDFESRISLNPQEQFALRKLKKEKLATKDALARVVENI